ncbi:MAG: hypothetical protein ACLTF8_01705 [Veillonella parvula]|uniref:hypothetical protein n=1 Tax=Veillonella parvula TaxID=29466 RepID=UPI0039919D48
MKEALIKGCKSDEWYTPIDTLGGVQRHKLFSQTNISVYVPTKRIKFISETGEHTKSPAHHSIIVMINAPKTEIAFEYQNKGCSK